MPFLDSKCFLLQVITLTLKWISITTSEPVLNKSSVFFHWWHYRCWSNICTGHSFRLSKPLGNCLQPSLFMNVDLTQPGGAVRSSGQQMAAKRCLRGSELHSGRFWSNLQGCCIEGWEGAQPSLGCLQSNYIEGWGNVLPFIHTNIG